MTTPQKSPLRFTADMLGGLPKNRPQGRAASAPAAARPCPQERLAAGELSPFLAQLVEAAALVVAMGGMVLALFALLHEQYLWGVVAFATAALLALLFRALGALLTWAYTAMLQLRGLVLGRAELRG